MKILFTRLFSLFLKPWGFRRDKSTTPVDYDLLGKELVNLLSESLKFESVDALKNLARAWQPLTDEKSIDREIFLFHKFLLVQACAGISSHQSIMEKMVTAFYASLDQTLKKVPASLDVTRFVRSCIGFGTDTLVALEKLWVTRSHQYDEPFSLDLEDFFKNRSGHLPWKRMTVRFMQNFKETSGPLHHTLEETPESVAAILSVAMTFSTYYENVAETAINHFGKKS